MHLAKGVPKKLLTLTLACALLSGCGSRGASATDQVDEVRVSYDCMTAYTASAAITANCSGRVYSYEADFSGDLTSGVMTVTAPDNIAGCSVSWDEGGTVLDWEQVELETGALNGDGLSPVDAMPTILTCCTTGLLLECSLEADGSELYAEFENPENPACTALCWFDLADHGLLRAELTSEGQTLVTLVFDSFRLESAPSSG
ncbi:MAG: hypothetical protein LUC48_05565 [Clostridiales bacterium]|nr:hypothetical protein [Clostridiales bacterium]